MMSLTLLQIEIYMSVPLMTQSFYLETQSCLAQNAMKNSSFFQEIVERTKRVCKIHGSAYALVGEA